MHDRHLALVVQGFHPAQRPVPAELGVDLEKVFLLDADRRPVLVVNRIAIRHDGVESIVAAEPLEDNQDLARRRGRRGTARLAQEVWDRANAAE